jgi:hypothetical protein
LPISRKGGDSLQDRNRNYRFEDQHDAIEECLLSTSLSFL